MQLGMVGLGRMGANMSVRLMRGGHQVVGYDLSTEAVERVVAEGAGGAGSLADLAERLVPPRTVWLMVPHGDPVDQAVSGLLPGLAGGDLVVDGGNSHYRATIGRAEALARSGIGFVDVGVSGGIWGLTEGYSLMAGGEPDQVDRLRPVLETLAPTPDSGWGRVGPVGAGHYAKMVHNGIEYGVMQAYAEGFAVLRAKKEWDVDLAAVGGIWRHGSVIRSWLLDLTVKALGANPAMEGVAPHVPDSGEGRWAVAEAIDLDVPVPVTALALLQRLDSRDEYGFADRLLAAMRGEFGGHTVEGEG